MVSAEHEWIDGGITAVPGILAAGLHAGIKPPPARDLALVYSSNPATAAGVFTTNRIVGAPVKVTRERIRSGVAQAIVASSGCSNVATGEQGVRDAREMTEIVAKHLRIPDERVLVASTGVIGRYLPMEKIRPALQKLVKGLSPEGSRAAAEGIMTTDTHPKEAALRVEIGGRRVTIGGIAKGTGMIHPGMATMFCFVATDMAVEREGLQGAIRRAVTGSFNRISVDGDRSTSDTVIILANGLAENRALARGDRRLRPFQQALDALTQRLAVMLVKDGEGATLVIDVRVRGAKTRGDAEMVARSIANSNLFKTAMAGPRSELGPGDVGAGRCGRGGPGGPGRDLVRRGAGGRRRPAPGRRPLGPGEGGAGEARGGGDGRSRTRLRPGPHLDLRPDDRLR